MIKGPNGCGKSTLCQLLCGLINNYEGNITIDNQNYQDINPKSLKNLVTYSDQKALLFKDTIINNITLGRNYDKDYFAKICEICDLESIVSKKPQRYNT